MSLALERIGPSGRRKALAGLAFLLAAITAGSQSSAAPEPSPTSGTITVVLDQAQVLKVPDGVATLIVGNPLIADISIQSGGLIVVTGKGYGVTNLVALDRGGQVLTQKVIQVQGPRDNLVVYRGVERESYSCTPKCEQRITLGDSPAYFGAVLGQIGARTSQAQGAIQPPK